MSDTWMTDTALETLKGIINDRKAELVATILSYRDGGDPVEIVRKIVTTKVQIGELESLLNDHSSAK